MRVMHARWNAATAVGRATGRAVAMTPSMEKAPHQMTRRSMRTERPTGMVPPLSPMRVRGVVGINPYVNDPSIDIYSGGSSTEISLVVQLFLSACAWGTWRYI